MFATIVNITNVFEIAITLFGIWQNKTFDFNSHQWCVNLPRGTRQPAPHIGQVDAGGMAAHIISYTKYYYTSIVIFFNAYVWKWYNLECVHAMIICENNAVFPKSDFWSKIRQPAPVSPTCTWHAGFHGLPFHAGRCGLQRGRGTEVGVPYDKKRRHGRPARDFVTHPKMCQMPSAVLMAPWIW